MTMRSTLALMTCVATLTACGVDVQDQRHTTTGAAVDDVDRPGERRDAAECNELPDRSRLRELLREAPGKGEVGGLAGGRYQWAAVVDRNGVLCAVAASTDDPAAVWPGSLGVAKGKAFTANAYSSDETPLSTARLYTLSQPGHSLWGIAAANPLHPDCLRRPGDDGDVGRVCGGTIAFGGGVALYRGNTKVGALGVSGDTACVDHELAKRMREAAGFAPAAGNGVDDIVYAGVDGPSVWAHPLCANTWRNGKKVGDETPSSGY
ncbi:MAG: GlcG/HbpS family heme-binding protein [Sinimarinibacterium flocculans]|uniref:GlcG/HbpS family heme-binding protein n=1 Tax=Sinimarinibacterium flocculans TaxID=985250 RepID=UPI003C331399